MRASFLPGSLKVAWSLARAVAQALAVKGSQASGTWARAERYSRSRALAHSINLDFFMRDLL